MSKRMNMKQYVVIGIGGMIGAVARYNLSIIFMVYNGFPYATLITNLIGCFLLSFLLHHDIIRKKLPTEVYKAINVGAIGSFTTFSTFTVETIELWNNHILLAIVYVLTSIGVGLLCCYGGYRLAIRKQVQI